MSTKTEKAVLFLVEGDTDEQSLAGVIIMGPLSRPHSKILRVHGGILFYAAKRLKYNLSGTSYPSAS